MKKISKTFAVIGLAAATSVAFANANYDMGPYISANLGGGIIHIHGDDSDFSGNSSADLKLLMGRAGMGYLFAISQAANPFFLGVEGDGDLGEVFYHGAHAKVYGGEGAAIVGKTFNSNIALYGKVGAQGLGNNNDFTTAPLLGAGVGYQLSQHVRLTVEENNSLYKDSTIFAGSIGLHYTFN